VRVILLTLIFEGVVCPSQVEFLTDK